MRKLLTSGITSTKRLPLFGESIKHVQDGTIECIDALAKAIIRNYSTGDVVILTGCENTGSGSNYIISSGYVYYNGEVYAVDAATFTVGGGQTAVGTITTTYNAIDPVTYSDGSTGSVHEIKKMVIAAGTSGSGTKDFSSFLSVEQKYIDVKFDATSHSVAHSTFEPLFSFTADAKLTNPSFHLQVTAGFSGSATAGTVNYKLRVNGGVVKSASSQYPSAYAGMSLRVDGLINYIGTIQKGDTVEIGYDTSAAVHPYVTISDAALTALCNSALF